MTEPTEPTTVYGRVVDHGGGRIDVLVARDTERYIDTGTPVVVSTVPPDGLWPGPDGGVIKPLTDLDQSWEWLGSDGIWNVWDPSDMEGNFRGLVVCRPVPAPEPDTERVPWAEVPFKMRTLAGTTVPVGGVRWDENLFVFCTAQGSPIAAVHDPAIGWDGSGTVTVLRDADPTPTDTPSDDEATVRPGPCSLCGKPTTRPDQHNVCDDCYAGAHQPTAAPSVVPADSPDTGRWTIDEDGHLAWETADLIDVAWVTPADINTNRVKHRREAYAALQALVRRDRQPTAEQVYEAMAPGDRPPVSEIRRVLAVVDACRTTEGTGE
jgi:hypothetical protein